MKFLRFLMLGLILTCAAGEAAADDDIFANEGITSFQQSSDAWRREDALQPAANTAVQTPKNKGILREISNRVGDAGLKNIENAEQIFCYEVGIRPSDYTGYTLDGMAVTGFCGVVKKEVRNIILDDLFKNDRNILFNVQEECVIRPRVVLRFVRGVDFTDVMFSSPCYSYAVYYGGQVNIFNTRPASKILDTLIASFMKNRVDFVSPALLEQLLPIGIPQTAAQKELVSNKPKPIRGWEKEKPKAAEAPKPEKKGWNNLDIGF